MSACISREGEYGEHVPGDARFTCSRCGAFCENAVMDALDAAKETLDRVAELATNQARACQAAHRADHARNWLYVLTIIAGADS